MLVLTGGKDAIAMADSIVFGLDPGNSESTGVIAPACKSQVLTIPSDFGAGSLYGMGVIAWDH
jgi:hypothetical protein